MLDLLLAAGAEVAFTFTDPRIDESSGLATSTDGRLVYTHNDSGDISRFFAVGLDGRTRTTYVLPDVHARDWEDMARGPDEQGRPCLWLADIGDNDARRDRGILVHRVREPRATTRERVVTEPPTSFRLLYPDGPGDAEGLMVSPRTGRLYVVTKPLAGPAQVYAAPEVLDPHGPNRLERVAQAPVQATGTPGGPGIGGLANLLVTAADIAPDGSRVAVRTYTDLYEWDVPGDDVAAAFRGTPTVTPLPVTRQGEGLAYAADGRSVLVSSEGRGTPVHRITTVRARTPRAAPQAPRRNVDRTVPIALGAFAGVVLLVLGVLRRRSRTHR